MKSEHVTQAWEFCRDNCQGFKEPMRKQFRKLDDYVSGLEDENAKLRELVRSMWVHSYCCIAECFEDDERHIDDTINRMRELGVEVEP